MSYIVLNVSVISMFYFYVCVLLCILLRLSASVLLYLSTKLVLYNSLKWMQNAQMSLVSERTGALSLIDVMLYEFYFYE